MSEWRIGFANGYWDVRARMVLLAGSCLVGKHNGLQKPERGTYKDKLGLPLE
jgi:hypothetical protein